MVAKEVAGPKPCFADLRGHTPRDGACRLLLVVVVQWGPVFGLSMECPSTHGKTLAVRHAGLLVKTFSKICHTNCKFSERSQDLDTPRQPRKIAHLEQLWKYQERCGSAIVYVLHTTYVM